MGTPMALTMSNLFMGWLEANLLKQSPTKIDADCWKRFVDDILILLMDTQEETNL